MEGTMINELSLLQEFGLFCFILSFPPFCFYITQRILPVIFFDAFSDFYTVDWE